jgi:hypothetical protein
MLELKDHSPVQSASGALGLAFVSRVRGRVGRECQTRSTAAPMNDENSGCGSNGRDFNSRGRHADEPRDSRRIRRFLGRMPSGDSPEKRMPCCSRRALVAVLNPVRWQDDRAAASGAKAKVLCSG